jgi:lysophospholipase L1-like esterase
MNLLCRFCAAVLLACCVRVVAEAATPRLVLVGDSTVKNGRGDGSGGLWGWGQVLAEQFDPARIEIENRALGGRSSRTYQTEGLWERSLKRLRPGDFVLIQFGHNDGGQLFDGDRPRASLKGNTDDTKSGVVEMSGKEETVHSYGWYIRRYVTDAKARGATPIVLSLVPRNIWKNGHVVRASGDYGKWAAQAARQTGAAFIDLNELVALRYEAEGEETVRRDYFTAADHTHTTEAGARVSAACVADGVRRLVDCPLRRAIATSSTTAPAPRPICIRCSAAMASSPAAAPRAKGRNTFPCSCPRAITESSPHAARPTAGRSP